MLPALWVFGPQTRMIWLFVSCVVLSGLLVVPRALRSLIRRRLGGYRQVVTEPDLSLPLTRPGLRRVAVLGGGVAGVTAALTLARRGYPVTLIEKKKSLGGKLGSVLVDLGGGNEAWVSHGFHAFFRHYHNLNRFLDSLSLRRNFVAIDDYLILSRDGRRVGFGGVDPTPVFNLFGLLRRGLFSWGDALRAPGRDMYGVLLEYEEKETFRKYDKLSYAEFSARASVPPRLKLAFNTFARAFFADENKLSLAELIKSFHFYYLSHDGGLVYDYPVEDYEAGLFVPIEAELERRGARVKKGLAVQSLRKADSSYWVDGEEYGAVVLATDVSGVREIGGMAEGFPAEVRVQLGAMAPGQRYAVWRLWLDRDIRDGIPHFVITERRQLLDSVTTFHRFELQTQAFMTGVVGCRAVLELHCYSVADELSTEQVREGLWSELLSYAPELEGARILLEHFNMPRDFTAFHVGLFERRPTVDLGVPGFYCAGDWVRLPFPAMLLEAACASGLVAANSVLAEDGLRAEPVLSVPLRGLMAGVPAPPGRSALDRAPD